MCLSYLSYQPLPRGYRSLVWNYVWPMCIVGVIHWTVWIFWGCCPSHCLLSIYSWFLIFVKGAWSNIFDVSCWPLGHIFLGRTREAAMFLRFWFLGDSWWYLFPFFLVFPGSLTFLPRRAAWDSKGACITRQDLFFHRNPSFRSSDQLHTLEVLLNSCPSYFRITTISSLVVYMHQ